jgi:transcriptional regulator with GAF, ATPase, and Fis domain
MCRHDDRDTMPPEDDEVTKGSVRLETTLGRVALRMASSLELDEVLAEITRGLVVELEAALARIWLVRPQQPESLELVASAGLSERVDGSHRSVAIGSLKIGEIARTRAPVCANDLLEDPRFVDKTWIVRNALTTFAGYPLVFESELVGVLAMFSRRPLADVEFEALGMFAAQASIAVKNARLFANVTELGRRLEAENAYLKEELGEVANAKSAIVGQSAALARVLGELERVAPTTSNVLLLGETGTGKELFARAVHEMSPRRQGPLINVSCAAFAATLIESELFGHEKGAFTGALQRRIGRFELARGGTLFLDEIGELPLESQAKLLRVLQEHEIERIGAARPTRVDARIVAATNRDLAAEVRANRFRSDLFFRLNVFPLTIPPLRKRREDIPEIARAFLRTLAARLGSAPLDIDDDAMAYLQAYDWPGNVRELQNVIERAAILVRSGRLTMTDLPELSASPPERAEHSNETQKLPLKERIHTYERAIIVDALREAGGNQSDAARILGTTRTTLQYKLKLFRITNAEAGSAE